MEKIVLLLACACLLLLLASGCARYLNKNSGSIVQVGQPVRVSQENTDAAEPAVAAAPDGTAYVAWVVHRANKESDVFVAHLDGEGRATGEPVRVNEKAGEATAWRGDQPTIRVAPDGSIYVGWTGRVAGERHATNLYLSASHDGGRTFSPPSKVNDDQKPGSHGMHSLAVASDGRIHLAWLDERNVGPPAGANSGQGQAEQHMERNSEVFTAFSADGGRSFSPNRRVASEACPCCKTSLAVAPDGRVYVGWRQVLPGEYRHIAVSSSADGGQTFSSPVIVADDQWVIAGCPVSGPALNVTRDSALRVMWYTAGERGKTGLYWAESRDAGKTFSESRLFAGGQAFGAPLLLANGRDDHVAVWANDDGGAQRVMASTLNAGDNQSAHFVISAELPSAATAGDQLFVGYIINANDRRSIWVARAKLAA
ncbi:MAG TPA: sialidase family protein [Pyrinomonadaceae bacterium]